MGRWAGVRACRAGSLAAVVVVSLLAASPAESTVDATTSAVPVSHLLAHQQPCADVLFVGARGSGQRDMDAQGLGPEVQVVRDTLVASLPQDVRVRQVYVDYVAQPVEAIAVDINPFDPGSPYFDSIDDGVAGVADALQDSLLRCEDERWVVSGYSQGALAANLGVRGFLSSGRLAGMVLVADPARHRDAPHTPYGDAQAGDGIYTGIDGTVTTMGSQLGGVTSSICLHADIVCDTSRALENQFFDPFGIHVSYAREHRDLLARATTPTVRRIAAALGRSAFEYVDTVEGSRFDSPYGNGYLRTDVSADGWSMVWLGAGTNASRVQTRPPGGGAWESYPVPAGTVELAVDDQGDLLALKGHYYYDERALSAVTLDRDVGTWSEPLDLTRYELPEWVTTGPNWSTYSSPVYSVEDDVGGGFVVGVTDVSRGTRAWTFRQGAWSSVELMAPPAGPVPAPPILGWVATQVVRTSSGPGLVWNSAAGHHVAFRSGQQWITPALPSLPDGHYDHGVWLTGAPGGGWTVRRQYYTPSFPGETELLEYAPGRGWQPALPIGRDIGDMAYSAASGTFVYVQQGMQRAYHLRRSGDQGFQTLLMAPGCSSHRLFSSVDGSISSLVGCNDNGDGTYHLRTFHPDGTETTTDRIRSTWDGTSLDVAELQAVAGGRAKPVFAWTRNTVGTTAWQVFRTSDLDLRKHAGGCTRTPAVLGAAEVGRTLQYSEGDWPGALIGREVTWLRDGQPVSEYAAYVLTDADLGHRIRVRVRVRSTTGAATCHSPETDVVTVAQTPAPPPTPPTSPTPTQLPSPTTLPAPVPVPTTIPVPVPPTWQPAEVSRLLADATVKGRMRVGERLRLKGLQALDDPAIRLRVTWYADGSRVARATTPTLRLTRSLKGSAVSVVVKAFYDGGARSRRLKLGVVR